MKLGIDPDFHGVSAKPHQLVIYDQSSEESYIHKFDHEPGKYYLLSFTVYSYHRQSALLQTPLITSFTMK